jgi:hypothetical protein
MIQKFCLLVSDAMLIAANTMEDKYDIKTCIEMEEHTHMYSTAEKVLLKILSFLFGIILWATVFVCFTIVFFILPVIAYSICMAISH